MSVPIRAEFPHGRHGWVLARRNLTTGEPAYYGCFGPRGTRLRTAGARWVVEEGFQTTKNEDGLIPLIVNEIRHLLAARSTFRRRCLRQARNSHYLGASALIGSHDLLRSLHGSGPILLIEIGPCNRPLCYGAGAVIMDAWRTCCRI